jgi:hypothetical protein
VSAKEAAVFDRYDRSDRSTNVHMPETLEVNVKRAPTDDSVRLLREMEEKARDQVLSATIHGDGQFSVTLVRMVADPLTVEHRLYVCWKLNGKEHKHEAPARDHGDATAALRFVAGKIAAEVTDAIFRQLVSMPSGVYYQRGKATP